MSRVTVLGAGNAGHAISFEIASNGGEVMLFEHPDFAKNLDGIRQKGGIEAVKELEAEGTTVPAMLSGFAKVAGLTTNPQEAMDFADIVVMIVPEFAHATIFKLVLPYLRNGQLLVTLPGNFASLRFKKMLREAGCKKDVTFVDTGSIPYAVRIIGPGTIYIEGKKTAFQVGALPSGEINNVMDKLREVLFLRVVPAADTLLIGLANPNMIMHVATAALSMGPMESRQGKIQFYAEGCSDSVAKVLEQEDLERLAVCQAYGRKAETFLETVNMYYGLQMKSIRDFAKNTPIHNRMPNDSPQKPSERYISEDCPSGLVAVWHFGKLFGIECPTIEAIIRICNIYNNVDYFTAGVTPEKLGLGGMHAEEIHKYLAEKTV